MAAAALARVRGSRAVWPLVVLAPIPIAVALASWVRAIGWFEFVFLIPLLLGVAGLLAQPACYSGDPPAPTSGWVISA